MTRRTTVYIDASLMTDPQVDAMAMAAELEMVAVVVRGPEDLPAELDGAWHLTAKRPEAGSPWWSRTVLVGPRTDPGRRAVTGLRSARDLLVSLLELASEAAVD